MAKTTIRSRDPKSGQFVKRTTADKNPEKYINREVIKKKNK